MDSAVTKADEIKIRFELAQILDLNFFSMQKKKYRVS